MEVGACIITVICALFIGAWLGVLAEAAWGYGAEFRFIAEKLDRATDQLAAAIKERDRYKKSAIEAADIGDIAVDGLYRARLAIDELTNAVKSYRSETDGGGRNE